MAMTFRGFYSEIGDFNHAEEEDGIDQARDEQSDDVFVMSGVDAALDQIPFAEESSGWRNADEREGSYEEADERKRHFLELAVHRREVSFTGLGKEDTSEKEYAERHEGVGYDVIDRADHARFVG